MRKNFLMSFALGLYIMLAGCASEAPSESQEIAIQVNKSKITLTEFNDLLKFEAYADPEVDLTEENRDQFIDYLIRKELMIQEAARLQLDQKKDFMLTIEKYWESTLIRNLLNLKAEELKKKVLVTEDEIGQYYEIHKQDFQAPLAEVKEGIQQVLESEKMEEKLEEWTSSLRENAEIKVDRQLISQARQTE